MSSSLAILGDVTASEVPGRSGGSELGGTGSAKASVPIGGGVRGVPPSTWSSLAALPRDDEEFAFFNVFDGLGFTEALEL
jgi:hypothetical protein